MHSSIIPSRIPFWILKMSFQEKSVLFFSLISISESWQFWLDKTIQFSILNVIRPDLITWGIWIRFRLYNFIIFRIAFLKKNLIWFPEWWWGFSCDTSTNMDTCARAHTHLCGKFGINISLQFTQFTTLNLWSFYTFWFVMKWRPENSGRERRF